jgi:hypothetical protein
MIDKKYLCRETYGFSFAYAPTTPSLYATNMVQTSYKKYFVQNLILITVKVGVSKGCAVIRGYKI